MTMTPAQALLREVARDPGAIHLDLELRLAIDEELERAAVPDWPSLVGPVTGEQVHRRFRLIRDARVDD